MRKGGRKEGRKRKGKQSLENCRVYSWLCLQWLLRGIERVMEWIGRIYTVKLALSIYVMVLWDKLA